MGGPILTPLQRRNPPSSAGLGRQALAVYPVSLSICRVPGSAPAVTEMCFLPVLTNSLSLSVKASEPFPPWARPASSSSAGEEAHSTQAAAPRFYTPLGLRQQGAPIPRVSHFLELRPVQAPRATAGFVQVQPGRQVSVRLPWGHSSLLTLILCAVPEVGSRAPVQGVCTTGPLFSTSSTWGEPRGCVWKKPRDSAGSKATQGRLKGRVRGGAGAGASLLQVRSQLCSSLCSVLTFSTSTYDFITEHAVGTALKPSSRAVCQGH